MDARQISAGTDAAFDAASAAFMRTMLSVSGSLLADVAGGVRPANTLRYLCDAAKELLGAADVVLRLHEDSMGMWGEVESSRAVPEADAPMPQIRRDIRGTGNALLGRLDISWSDTTRPTTPLDHAVAGQFASMSALVLERHLSNRRQLQAVAREREAFAGEIHDDPVQVMTAVSLQLQRLATRLPEGEDRSAVHRARSLNDEAMERLRHVMFSLHPTTLVEDGLAVSIEAYCESFVEIQGLRSRVIDNDIPSIPLEVAALGFRLCRNALVNVVEHAEATEVVVDISCPDGCLRVEIRDDGIGFDIAEVRHTRVGHLGIPHAIALASWVSGSYVTESEPGNGTTVTIELPIL